VRRREFIGLLGGATTWPLLAYAQGPAANIPVIGFLSPAPTQTVRVQLLRDALAKHGLVDGKNIRIDVRVAEGRLERLPGLAEALVREGATVIFATGDAAGWAAQAATNTLPIITIGDDLVGSGLVSSLARPGANITGVSILATELDAKKIELLKEPWLCTRLGWRRRWRSWGRRSLPSRSPFLPTGLDDFWSNLRSE